MITFKRNKPEGRYRSFFNVQTDVKLNKRIVGSIQEGDGFNNWRVSVVVKDDTQNCGWRFAKLKKIFVNEQEARDWLKENFDEISTKLNVVSID